jgi:hypothetical protein
MRGTKILIVLGCVLGLVAAWTPAAEAQSFIGEVCWTVQPASNPPALAHMGVTYMGAGASSSSYYLLQGYVTGVPQGVPILFGSGIFNGGNLYLNLTLTMEEGTTFKSAAQMRGVLNGTTLSGSLWEMGLDYNPTGNPTTPIAPYFDGLTMTYNPTCTLP